MNWTRAGLSRRLLQLALLSTCLNSSGAGAQDRFAIEAFEPAPFVERSILNVYGSRTYEPRAYTFTVMGAYGRKPLSLENTRTGETVAELVGSVGTLNLMGAVGLWKRLDVGIALPIHRVSRGSEIEGTPPAALRTALMESTQVALGDLRLVPRLRVAGGAHGFGLGLLLPMHLPTGKDEYYAGEPFRIEPRMSVDWLSERGALVALNAGYMFRSRTHVLSSAIDDVLRLGAGADVPMGAGLSALAEIDLRVNVLGDGSGKTDTPTEGFLGLRFRKSGWLAQLGGGPGLVRGIGAPRYRLFASLSFSHAPTPDTDGDELADDVDRCPAEPEDKDGFEDHDGCPDPDNDHDGVADAADRCPGDPEDQDGFEDVDGCPDLDNDLDGVADAADACVNEPEDRDQFADDDGCPEPDNDGDSIADGDDRCPLEPGVPEQSGCPAPPAPPAPAAAVTLTEDAIELREPVLFEKNRAVIEQASDALLDEAAQLLVAHPEVERVVVEGHTDSSGSAARNRALSRARAQAVVKALVKRGVAAKRLRAEGLGPDQPVASNDTEEGRARNRRVVMRIAKRAPDQEQAGR